VLKPLQVQKAISYHLLNLAKGKINFKIYMKKVIIVALSAVVLVPLLFGFCAVWWSEHTYKLEEAGDYCEYTTKLLEGWCYNKDSCCASCLHDLMRFDHYFFGDEFDEHLEFLTPPEAIRHLGYLVANDLRLPNDRAIPIFICKTPIATVRIKEGEPSGKHHIPGFAHAGCRKMTPEEFESLNKWLFIDIEILIKELQKMSMDRNQQ